MGGEVESEIGIPSQSQLDVVAFYSLTPMPMRERCKSSLVYLNK